MHLMDDIFLLLFLLSVFFLVVGLILPTTFSRFFKGQATRKKIGLTFGGAMIVFFLLFGVTTETPASQQNPNPQTTATASNDEAPIVEQLQTPEDKIKTMIASAFSAKTNMGKTRVIDTEVTKQGEGYKVWVKFNADENLTASMTISAMKSDMAEYYRALYSQDLGVANATVTAYLELTDKYGNKSDERVFETVLTKAEAQKLNWNESDTMLRRQFIPNVWVVAFAHPVAR